MNLFKMWLRAGSLLVSMLFLLLPMGAQVVGTGTTNHVPLWTGTNNLGNSILVQIGGNVGIGTTSPAAILDVTGKPGSSSTSGGNAPIGLRIQGGVGGSNNGGFGQQGSGGPIQIATGTGASEPTQPLLGGAGAILLMTGGTGGICNPASVRCAGFKGGNGGSISLQPGSGGRGSSATSGNSGVIALAPTGGKVGVGTSAPKATFEVGAGHSTLADSWVTRSSGRLKINIHPLAGALEKIERLQGVSYDRKADGKHEIGVVAEAVDQVLPEIVSRDPTTKEIQGVDYSRLTALLIEAIKSQQAEIQHLELEIVQLKSNRTTH